MDLPPIPPVLPKQQSFVEKLLAGDVDDLIEKLTTGDIDWDDLNQAAAAWMLDDDEDDP